MIPLKWRACVHVTANITVGLMAYKPIGSNRDQAGIAGPTPPLVVAPITP